MKQKNVIQSVLDNYTDLFMVTGTGTLNVRREPNVGSGIIGTIDEYGGGEILSQEGEYFYISSGGITGYVNGAYIMDGDYAQDYIAEYAELQVRIRAENGVRVRTAPGAGDTIGTVSNGSLWEYLGEQKGYYKIRYFDTEAYVSEDFSKLGWFLKEAKPYYE